MRNVPEELETSLICHWPSTKLNSQCFRLTTFDLNPTGASEGPVGLETGGPSRSEYRPTLIILRSFGRVLEIGLKFRDCLPSLL